MKRHDKAADGKYHINGMTFPMLEGSRAQVFHGTAYKTPGGLTKKDLIMVRGRIVSKKKSQLAKSQKHLAGFLQPKGSGVFGTAKKGMKKSRKTRRRNKSKARK
jgi:hypothetical protein